MADYSALKATIDASINTNGQQAITGAILNDVLNEMVDVLGEGYTFLGVATISTNPTTPEGKAYYLAGAAGTYRNFGNIVVNDDEVALLVWNGTAWSKVVTGAASREDLSQLSQNFRKVSEQGFFISDESGNVVAKYNDDGFDVAKVSEHFIELLITAGVGGFSGVIMNTIEPGFFIVDGSLNVAFSVTSAGVRGVGIVPYEIS